MKQIKTRVLQSFKYVGEDDVNYSAWRLVWRKNNPTQPYGIEFYNRIRCELYRSLASQVGKRRKLDEFIYAASGCLHMLLWDDGVSLQITESCGHKQVYP